MTKNSHFTTSLLFARKPNTIKTPLKIAKDSDITKQRI